MISLEEVEKTILELEQRDTTFAVCERLAWLYVVRDHLTPTSRMISGNGQSEFLQAVSGKDANAVLEVVDKHMEAVKAVFPKEYSLVLQLINDI